MHMFASLLFLKNGAIFDGYTHFQLFPSFQGESLNSAQGEVASLQRRELKAEAVKPNRQMDVT